MSSATPLARISVGVILERHKVNSQWADFVWRPTAILGGLPNAEPWTEISTEGEVTTFYVGSADIELYRTETENYRSNLRSTAPSIWVVLHASGGEQPYEIAIVTADPSEGEALTESGQGIVEAVPMPDSVRDTIAWFIEQHHVERTFQKRKRDQADPEALARHGPIVGKRQ